MKALAAPLQAAIAAAATLTGKRFGLLVASSLVATSAIVAAAMTRTGSGGPLAALLGRSLAADGRPALAEPPPSPEPAAEPAGGSAQPAPEPASRRRPPPLRPGTPAGPGSDARASEPETDHRPLPKRRPRKRAGSNTSSSSPWPAPATKPPSATTPQMPYLAGDAAASGRPAQRLLAARRGRSAEFDRGDQRPAAHRGDQGRLPDYGKLRLLGRNPDPGRSARHRPVQLARLHGGHGRPRNRPARQLRLPAARRPRSTATGRLRAQPQPVRLFPLAARPRRLRRRRRPLHRTRKGSEEGRLDAELLLRLPQSLQRRRRRAVRGGTPDGAAAADAFLAPLVPKILASPAYKKDGLLIVGFGQVNPGPSTRRRRRRRSHSKSGRCWSRPSSPPAPPTPSPTTRTRCCARPRTSSASPTWPKADGAKVKSFAPALLGENGGD